MSQVSRNLKLGATTARSYNKHELNHSPCTMMSLLLSYYAILYEYVIGLLYFPEYFITLRSHIIRIIRRVFYN